MDRFNFDRVPPEMILQVVSKVPTPVLFKVQRTTKLFQEVCECRKTRATRQIGVVSLSYEGILIYLDDNRSIYFHEIQKPIGLPISLRVSNLTILTTTNAKAPDTIREFMATLRVEVNNLCLISALGCTEEFMCSMLDVVKPYKLTIKGYLRKAISPALFDNVTLAVSILSILQLTIVYLEGAEHSVQEICTIHADTVLVKNTEYTSEELNQALQSWYERPRRMTFYDTRQINVETVIENLPVSLIYNTESHDSSIFYSLKVNEMEEHFQTRSYYMLMKPEIFPVKYLLVLGKRSFEILRPMHQPANILYPLLVKLTHFHYSRYAKDYCKICVNSVCHCNCVFRS